MDAPSTTCVNRRCQGKEKVKFWVRGIPLVCRKVGRVTPCAPSLPCRPAARRGLTRPTKTTGSWAVSRSERNGELSLNREWTGARTALPAGPEAVIRADKADRAPSNGVWRGWSPQHRSGREVAVRICRIIASIISMARPLCRAGGRQSHQFARLAHV